MPSGGEQALEPTRRAALEVLGFIGVFLAALGSAQFVVLCLSAWLADVSTWQRPRLQADAAAFRWAAACVSFSRMIDAYTGPARSAYWARMILVSVLAE